MLPSPEADWADFLGVCINKTLLFPEADFIVPSPSIPRPPYSHPHNNNYYYSSQPG